MALFKFTKGILEGVAIPVFNRGKMVRDFTYIDDIVEGVIRAIDRPALPNSGWSGEAPDPATSYAPYRIYNIGNNQPVELMRYIEVLEESLEKAKLEMLPMQRMWRHAKSENLENDVGFRPPPPSSKASPASWNGTSHITVLPDISRSFTNKTSINMKINPVILSGGSGTRLWPLSREQYPKQLLSLMGERTLLQQTVSRLDGMEHVAEPLLVCNEEHRFLIAEQLRQLDKKPADIILEPVGRNTAPALTLAALALQKTLPEDELMLVMPADHVIQDVGEFHAAVRVGALLAEKGRLVTFGIVPTALKPDMGTSGKAMITR
jgi:hypothetical protein